MTGMTRRASFIIGLTALALSACAAPQASLQASRPHNVIIFVADGLRSQMVTPDTAPALAAVRDQGIDFRNSHSVYPTLTTVNAASIATGHAPGDHGDFGNTIFTGGDPLPAPVSATLVGLEEDQTLGLVNDRFGGNYLDEISLLAAARANGFQTAAIGKAGPVAIQDVTARHGETLMIDDQTGAVAPARPGLPLSEDWQARIRAAGLVPRAPDRGANAASGTHVANVEQQIWMAAVATKVVLPRFAETKKPFVMVYWSRDPDITQHGQGDSLGSLTPGINGPTSLAAIRNASNNLQALRDAVKALGLEDTTDIVVTADHGFSTISKQSETSTSAKMTFDGVAAGSLPPNFLGLDLARALNLPVYDQGGRAVDPSSHETVKAGGLMLGKDPKKPELAVAVNGGSDLIYVPSGDHALAQRVVDVLTAQDYTASLFVDDRLGPIAGTLPLSAIGLRGAALTPTPAIVVGFRSWTTGCALPETCGAEIADTPLLQGQGMHGSFSRADTHNFIAALGPDFRKGFVDPSPVANSDLTPTLVHILGLRLTAKGSLTGRVLIEALAKPKSVSSVRKTRRSAPAANGFVTILNYQEAGGRSYYDAAGAPGRTLGLVP